MPIYKFEETVEKIATAREVKLYDTHKRLLRQIKKDLESREITAEDVPDRLKDNDDFKFKFNFSSDDFKAIVSAIK